MPAIFSRRENLSVSLAGRLALGEAGVGDLPFLFRCALLATHYRTIEKCGFEDDGLKYG